MVPPQQHVNAGARGEHGDLLMSLSLLNTRVSIALVVAAVLASVGCSSTVDSITQRPGNVRASQGDFNERIRITWDAVIPQDDRVVEAYQVVRSDPGILPVLGFTPTVKAPQTSYLDQGLILGDLDNAKNYTYWVRTRFTDGSVSIWSSPATGYALDQDRLKVYQKEASARWSARDSEEGWYTAFLVAGWVYQVHIDPAPGGSFAPDLKVYRRGNIAEPVVEEDPLIQPFTFTPNTTGDFHFKIDSNETITRFRMRITY